MIRGGKGYGAKAWRQEEDVIDALESVLRAEQGEAGG